MVCNENIDYVLERDILINFILGLRPEIYEILIEKDNLTTLEAYFCEALKLEIKQEIAEGDESYGHNESYGHESYGNDSYEYVVKPEPNVDVKLKVEDTKHFLEQVSIMYHNYCSFVLIQSFCELGAKKALLSQCARHLIATLNQNTFDLVILFNFIIRLRVAF